MGTKPAQAGSGRSPAARARAAAAATTAANAAMGVKPKSCSPLSDSFSQFAYMPEPYERTEEARRTLSGRKSAEQRPRPPPPQAESRWSTMHPLHDMELAQIARELSSRDAALKEARELARRSAAQLMAEIDALQAALREKDAEAEAQEQVLAATQGALAEAMADLGAVAGDGSRTRQQLQEALWQAEAATEALREEAARQHEEREEEAQKLRSDREARPPPPPAPLPPPPVPGPLAPVRLRCCCCCSSAHDLAAPRPQAAERAAAHASEVKGRALHRMAAGCKGPSALSDDRAPSASLDVLLARGSPTHPGGWP